MSSPQGQPAARASSEKGGPKWLILGAGALALAGGGFVAYLKLGKPPAETSEAEKPARPVELEPSVVELEPFVLNLADPAGDRYFRLNLRLILDQKAVAERARAGLAHAKLRDRLLSILAKKRCAQVTSVEGKERLRVELQEAAQALLEQAPLHDAEHDPAPARVLEVFFTEFLVQ